MLKALAIVAGCLAPVYVGPGWFVLAGLAIVISQLFSQLNHSRQRIVSGH